MTTFGFLDTSIAVTGSTSGSSKIFDRNGSFAGRPAWQPTSGTQGWEREFIFRGTNLTLSYNTSSSAGLKITVDGTTTTPTLTTGNVWASLTLLSGASDINHTIKVKWTDANTAMDEAAWLTGTGSAPALSYPTSTAGLIYPLSDFEANLRLNDLSHGGYPLWTSPSCGATIDLKTTGAVDAIEVFTYASNSPTRVFSLAVNGSQTGATYNNPSSSDEYIYVPCGTSLGLTGSNSFRLFLSHEFGARGVNVYAIRIKGGGLLDTTFSPPTLPVYVGYGDSITEGNFGVPPQYNALSWLSLLGLSLGAVMINRGTSGQFVSTYLRDHTADIPTGASFMLLTGGSNDAQSGVGLSTFQADYVTQITNARARNAGIPIHCMSILKRTDLTDGNRASYNAAIVAAISASGDTNCHYADFSSLINTGTDLSDNVHPNDAGDAKIRDAWLAYLNAGAAVSGTVSTAGDATGNLTANTPVTLAGSEATTSAATGDLIAFSPSPVTAGGTSAGTSNVSGDLILTTTGPGPAVSVDGTALTAAAATGNLTVQTLATLTGTAPSSSSVTGNVSIPGGTVTVGGLILSAYALAHNYSLVISHNDPPNSGSFANYGAYVSPRTSPPGGFFATINSQNGTIGAVLSRVLGTDGDMTPVIFPNTGGSAGLCRIGTTNYVAHTNYPFGTAAGIGTLSESGVLARFAVANLQEARMSAATAANGYFPGQLLRDGANNVLYMALGEGNTASGPIPTRCRIMIADLSLPLPLTLSEWVDCYGAIDVSTIPGFTESRASQPTSLSLSPDGGTLYVSISSRGDFSTQVSRILGYRVSDKVKTFDILVTGWVNGILVGSGPLDGKILIKKDSGVDEYDINSGTTQAIITNDQDTSFAYGFSAFGGSDCYFHAIPYLSNTHKMFRLTVPGIVGADPTGGGGGGCPAPPAPAAPTSPGTCEGARVSLSIPAMSGVLGYGFYRDGTLIATTTLPHYVDTGVTLGTLYSYTATAYNACGESDPSPAYLRTPCARAGEPDPRPDDPTINPCDCCHWERTESPLRAPWARIEPPCD